MSQYIAKPFAVTNNELIRNREASHPPSRAQQSAQVDHLYATYKKVKGCDFLAFSLTEDGCFQLPHGCEIVRVDVEVNGYLVPDHGLTWRVDVSGPVPVLCVNTNYGTPRADSFIRVAIRRAAPEAARPPDQPAVSDNTGTKRSSRPQTPALPLAKCFCCGAGAPADPMSWMVISFAAAGPSETALLCPSCGPKGWLLLREMDRPRSGHTKKER